MCRCFIFHVCVCVCLGVFTSVRVHSTLQLPSMYDSMIDFIKKKTFSFLIITVYLSCPHHVNEFSMILTTYYTILIYAFEKRLL